MNLSLHWTLALAGHLVWVALVVFVFLRLLREHRSPPSTMAWTIAVLLIPYIGIPVFLILGGRRIRSAKKKKGNLFSRRSNQMDLSEAASGVQVEIARVLDASGMPPAKDGNHLEVIPKGELAYRHLLEMIESAKREIDITTFILGRDAVGKKFVDALAAKAREGVKVRLLLDALGCLWTRGSFVDPIRRAGGKIGVFMPILPLRRKWSTHLRNHRKLMVIDSTKAIVGGINLANEYIGPDFDPKRWADICAVIEGPTVAALKDIFEADWSFATDEKPEKPSPPTIVEPTTAGNQRVQAIASGPDAETYLMRDALTVALLGAKRRAWVVTPYFIPDESLSTALGILGRTGRDVRIITPAKSNHRIADMARGAYFRDLADTNIKLYAYQTGMLHAKLIVIDDSITFIGSANMDIRSLYLDYELGVWVSSPETNQAISEVISGWMDQSTILPPKGELQENKGKEMTEDICRLFAPLL